MKTNNIEMYAELVSQMRRQENNKTQERRIIDFLKANKTGTTFDFTRYCYIMSPRKIISIIRAKSGITGLTIVSERVSQKGVHFNIYRLARCKKTKPAKKR